MSRTFYIKTYGCQMNVADSELVSGILIDNGYKHVEDIIDADIILLNTCSVREKAENTLTSKVIELKKYRKNKIIGILGCMAERLSKKILESFDNVSFVIGPDEYRNIIKAVEAAFEKQRNSYVKLSLKETYEDIMPRRVFSNGISSFVSIMRGCDNMCAYCVVPFTRGRERSRNNESIIREVEALSYHGYKEVTLLGQNVNSYKYEDITFAKLLEQVAQVNSRMRIRFTSPHPKDFDYDVLDVMSKYKNLCRYIHIPFQSGSDAVLKNMNRPYTREQYLEKIKAIREVLGEDCGLTSDILVGFCDETLKDHEDTLSLMEAVKFDSAYMFAYSERSGTKAAAEMNDNVPYEEKIRRLNEVIDLQNKHSLERNKKEIGKTLEVLVERKSKKSDNKWQGRTDNNKMVVFSPENKEIFPGSFVNVKINDCSSASLIGSLEN